MPPPLGGDRETRGARGCAFPGDEQFRWELTAGESRGMAAPAEGHGWVGSPGNRQTGFLQPILALAPAICLLGPVASFHNQTTSRLRGLLFNDRPSWLEEVTIATWAMCLGPGAGAVSADPLPQRTGHSCWMLSPRCLAHEEKQPSLGELTASQARTPCSELWSLGLSLGSILGEWG